MSVPVLNLLVPKKGKGGTHLVMAPGVAARLQAEINAQERRAAAAVGASRAHAARGAGMHPGAGAGAGARAGVAAAGGGREAVRRMPARQRLPGQAPQCAAPPGQARDNSRDWVCPKSACGNVNFSWRGAQPAHPCLPARFCVFTWPATHGRTGLGHTWPSLRRPYRPVVGSRTGKCHRCDASRPETVGGDWLCPKAACRNLNYAWRTECNRCNCSRKK